MVDVSCLDIPNSSRGLVRLDYRTKEWDVDFRKYLKSLADKKPVVWCGDLNVAHKEAGAYSSLIFINTIIKTD